MVWQSIHTKSLTVDLKTAPTRLEKQKEVDAQSQFKPPGWENPFGPMQCGLSIGS
jgi:hypothetical protein